MKIKNGISILTFTAVLLTGCYDDSKNATVRINLGNIPVAKSVEKKSFIDKIFSVFVKDAYAQTLPQDVAVITIHLAAYKGDEIIAKESIDTTSMTSNVVEFTVPAGADITILIVGESVYVANGNHYAKYFGNSNVTLSYGETKDVSIDMQSTKFVFGDTILYDCNNSQIPMTWTEVGGKVKFYLEIWGGNSFFPEFSSYENEFSNIQAQDYQFYMRFETFNLLSEVSDAFNPVSPCM